MLAGQAMPGVRDGYCRIERSHSDKDIDYIVITPLDPGAVLKNIPSMVRLALDNKVIDTADFSPLAAKKLNEGLHLLETVK